MLLIPSILRLVSDIPSEIPITWKFNVNKSLWCSLKCIDYHISHLHVIILLASTSRSVTYERPLPLSWHVTSNYIQPGDWWLYVWAAVIKKYFLRFLPTLFVSYSLMICIKPFTSWACIWSDTFKQNSLILLNTKNTKNQKLTKLLKFETKMKRDC